MVIVATLADKWAVAEPVDEASGKFAVDVGKVVEEAVGGEDVVDVIDKLAEVVDVIDKLVGVVIDKLVGVVDMIDKLVGVVDCTLGEFVVDELVDKEGVADVAAIPLDFGTFAEFVSFVRVKVVDRLFHFH